MSLFNPCESSKKLKKKKLRIIAVIEKVQTTKYLTKELMYNMNKFIDF